MARLPDSESKAPSPCRAGREKQKNQEQITLRLLEVQVNNPMCDSRIKMSVVLPNEYVSRKGIRPIRIQAVRNNSKGNAPGIVGTKRSPLARSAGEGDKRG